MRNKILLPVLLLLLFTTFNVSVALSADEESLAKEAEQAGKLRKALTHYVSALQSASEGSAKDQALREKIIALAQKVKPAPAVPEEAQKNLGRGIAAFEIAKSPSDLTAAISEFKNAARAAPWWADAYFNLGLVQEKAGQFNAAMQSFKLYLLAAPSAPEAQDVRTRIYGLELKAERQQKENREKAASTEREGQAEERRRNMEALVASLPGIWWNGCPAHGTMHYYEIRIRNGILEYRFWMPKSFTLTVDMWSPWLGEYWAAKGNHAYSYRFEPRTGSFVSIGPDPESGRTGVFKIISPDELVEERSWPGSTERCNWRRQR